MSATMYDLILHFPENLRQALQIGRSHRYEPTAGAEIRSVLVTGLGGSGIGGKVVQNIVAHELQVPFLVSNEYSVPNWVNEHTLVIANSYSGNTEETLEAVRGALVRQAQVCVITSGGTLLDLAKKHNLPHIVIPSGQPPRTSLGFNATQLFFHLHYQGLISDAFMAQLAEAADVLTDEQEQIQNLAQNFARLVGNRIPVIYATQSLEGTAVRLRQQINENAKTLCWHHILPEMNHNELVAWAGGSDQYAVLVLHSPSDDHPRSWHRMRLSLEIISRKTPHILNLVAKGDNVLVRNYYLIHLGDWLSHYMAEMKGVDPIEIEVIDYLKNELARIA